MVCSIDMELVLVFPGENLVFSWRKRNVGRKWTIKN